MKTASMILTHINLRQHRAQALANAVLRRLEPHLEQDSELHVIEALLDLFTQEGIEVVTDHDREYHGLPTRGPEGWTTSELVALEHARLALMLRPLAVPVYVSVDRKTILEEAAGVADRRAAALRKIPGYRSEEAELVTLGAAIRSLA